MPSWHLHRQLALLTHLEHPIESSAVSTPTVCLVSLFALHYWAAADLVDVLVIAGSGRARCPSCAWLAFSRNCCTQALLSLSPFVSAKSLVRGCVHPLALIAAPTSGCGACGDTASSSHSMTVCSAGAAASTVASIESIIVGMGESLTCTSCSSLTSSCVLETQQLAHCVRCLWLLGDCNLLLASRGTEGIPDLQLL